MAREKTRFIPINPDRRGNAGIYKCEHCGCWMQTGYYMLGLEYNFCPWCGAEADAVRAVLTARHTQ